RPLGSSQFSPEFLFCEDFRLAVCGYHPPSLFAFVVCSCKLIKDVGADLVPRFILFLCHLVLSCLFFTKLGNYKWKRPPDTFVFEARCAACTNASLPLTGRTP